MTFKLFIYLHKHDLLTEKNNIPTDFSTLLEAHRQANTCQVALLCQLQVSNTYIITSDAKNIKEEKDF